VFVRVGTEPVLGCVGGLVCGLGWVWCAFRCVSMLLGVTFHVAKSDVWGC
jgi:hypothetical protein